MSGRRGWRRATAAKTLGDMGYRITLPGLIEGLGTGMGGSLGRGARPRKARVPRARGRCSLAFARGGVPRASPAAPCSRSVRRPIPGLGDARVGRGRSTIARGCRADRADGLAPRRASGSCPVGDPSAEVRARRRRSAGFGAAAGGAEGGTSRPGLFVRLPAAAAWADGGWRGARQNADRRRASTDSRPRRGGPGGGEDRARERTPRRRWEPGAGAHPQEDADLWGSACCVVSRSCVVSGDRLLRRPQRHLPPVHGDLLARPLSPPRRRARRGRRGPARRSRRRSRCSFRHTTRRPGSSTRRSLLALRYPQHEVVVVSDGSRTRRSSGFTRRSTSSRCPSALRRPAHAAVRGSWVSRRDRHLGRRQGERRQGGLAERRDQRGRYPYVCSIDADTLIESDALLRVAKPVLDDPDRDRDRRHRADRERLQDRRRPRDRGRAAERAGWRRCRWSSTSAPSWSAASAGAGCARC